MRAIAVRVVVLVVLLAVLALAYTVTPASADFAPCQECIHYPMYTTCDPVMFGGHVSCVPTGGGLCSVGRACPEEP